MEQSLKKIQSRFYPGDLMTRSGDREICSVFRRVGISAVESALVLKVSVLLIFSLRELLQES